MRSVVGDTMNVEPNYNGIPCQNAFGCEEVKDISISPKGMSVGEYWDAHLWYPKHEDTRRELLSIPSLRVRSWMV